MVQFHKWFQFHPEFAAVMQQSLVMVGNTPGTGIGVIAGCEADLLGRTTQFGYGIAPTQADIAATGPVLEFQNLHMIACLAQFISGKHARKSRPQNQHTCAGLRTRQDGGRCKISALRVSHGSHGLIQGGTTGECANAG